MTLPERGRWLLAIAGPLLFETSSFMPLFGGTAKHLYLCRGEEFTGTFDNCFNDYLPILELMLPLFCLALLYPFARFAFSLFAPDPAHRSLGWKLASSSAARELYPMLHAIAAVGAAWAVWRAATYPLTAELLPYSLFWLVFAAWFSSAVAIAWPGKGSR